MFVEDVRKKGSFDGCFGHYSSKFKKSTRFILHVKENLEHFDKDT